MIHEPEDEDVELELDETPSEKQLTHDIDEELAKVRPERYSAEGKDWMESVVDMAAGQLNDRKVEELKRDLARRRVYRREAEATKKTNKVLREIYEEGRLPFGWGDPEWEEALHYLLHLPLSIARQRVRLGVASAQDLEQWELESGREEDKRKAAQIAARRGARLLQEWLREQKAKRVDQLKPATEQMDEAA